MIRAMSALTEYRMVKAGVATYASLGYGESRVKLIEWLAIDSELQGALEEKHRRDAGKR